MRLAAGLCLDLLEDSVKCFKTPPRGVYTLQQTLVGLRVGKEAEEVKGRGERGGSASSNSHCEILHTLMKHLAVTKLNLCHSQLA